MKDPLLFGVSARQEDGIARQIMAVIRSLLFQGIADVIEKATAQGGSLKLMNAPGDALRDAIRSGRIQYEAGVFSGIFGSAVARALREIGAKLDKRDATYRLPPSQVPAWVTAEATAYRAAAAQAHRQMLVVLDDARQNLTERLETKSVDATLAIADLTRGWREAAASLEVNPDLPDDAAERLRLDYDENAKLPIQGFVQEEVERLREIVRDNAAQGYRFDRLIPAVEARYSVAKGKAAFLARQETSLLVSKFRQQRFEDAGATDYIWMTSHDARVRDSHKDLDGTRQSFKNPPMVDGRQVNPGEDFNCRCVARPILVGIGEARRAA